MTEKIKELLPTIQNHEIFQMHDFRLVGGTAMSYHLNHRISEDLDFCILDDLPLDDIQNFIEFCIENFTINDVDYVDPSEAVKNDFLIGGSNVEYYLQTWIVKGAKIQFYDGSGHLGAKDIFENDAYSKIGNIKIASLDTIFKMKSLMFYKRAKSRDLFDMITFYAQHNSEYSPMKTRQLIMNYDKLYNNEDAFKFLWLEAFKNREYIKDFDEGLMGLTIDPKSYFEMRDELVELLQ
ncbi:MAG: nucleotidyl transferase AbiEii/AbiGii toxin family protein [Sulfurimonas sp.]